MSSLAVQPDAERLNWIQSNLHIITKEGTRIRLTPNVVQLRLHMAMQAQRVRGLPVRIRMLKFRQWGGCLAPNTSILTADLQWVPIGSLQIGDSLVSCDDRTGVGRGGSRKMRTAAVEKVWRTRKRAFRITLSDGISVVCSADHRWLSRKSQSQAEWRSIAGDHRDGLAVGDEIRTIADVWTAPNLDDAWLDGEGRLISRRKCGGSGLTIAIRTLFRVPGLSRPARFIGRTRREGSRLPDYGWREIIDIKSGDESALIDIETSTGTYIANGIVSHNSTWISAEGFYEVYHKANWRAMGVSVDNDSTEHIFRMIKVFNEDLSPSIKRPTDNSNYKEIAFSKPHRSRYLSQTAGKMSLGHSFTSQYLHGSEVARWENAEVQMSGLTEMVPMKPGTTIVQETTGNGQGGYFYDGFVDGVKWKRKHPDDFTGYQNLFFPWYIFPEYSQEPPKRAAFSREERVIQKQYELTDGQLYWRQLKLAEKNGDLGLFMENYPSSWQEAFQASGHPVFPAETISVQAGYLGTQFRRVIFDEGGGKVTAEATEETRNTWLVHAPVKDDHEYAVGIDTMEGRLSDVRNPKSDLDCDGIVVMDRNTGEDVAIYEGRGDQRELGKQAFRAAVYYNEAWVAPEIPQSMVLLSYFKERGYPYLYNRVIHEDREMEGESEVLGWRTTAITRKWLVEDFVVAAKDGSVKVIFPEVLDQMRGYVHSKDGRPDHLPGEHDDLLIGNMIALQVHKHCPIGTAAVKQSHTGRTDDSEHHKTERDLARINALDDWDPENDEEGDEQEYTG